MAIFRQNTTPLPSTPPQDNIERGDEVVAQPTVLPPTLLTAPIVSGGTVRGAVLTATPAVWKNQSSLTITRGWFRDDVAIVGQSNLTYATQVADETHVIKYKETATNSAGSTSTSSPGVTITAPVVGNPPVVAAAPTIAGTQFKVGYILTGTPGTFTGADSVTNRWEKGGVTISTALTYTPVDADAGSTLKFISRGTNQYGSTDNASAATTTIAAADVTPPPTEFVLSFELASTAPTGVTVARAGGAGTYVNSDVRLASAAANTPRIEHNGAGSPVGLLLEKARTNMVTHGKNPFSGGEWYVLENGIMTANAQDDVMGTVGAGLLQVNTGGPYSGVRYQAHNTLGPPLLVQMYTKTNGADTPMSGQLEGVTIRNWTRHDLLKPAAANYQLDIVAPNGGLVDARFFGVGIYENGQIGESIILTTGSAVTRPKEVMTFTSSSISSTTYDIRVRFANGGGWQDFPGELCSGTWVLDADELVTGANKNIIRNIGFYPVGGLPPASSEETPSAPPPTTPPPAGTFGKVTVVGDSLSAGDSATTLYSPPNYLKTRLTNAGYTFTMVGTHTSPGAFPGNVPVSGQPGWHYSDLNSNLAATIALNPDRVFMVIYPNGPETMEPNITTYLNALAAGMGLSVPVSGTVNKTIVVSGPYLFDWMTGTVLTQINSIKTKMQQWAALDPTHRKYVNLNNSIASGGPGFNPSVDFNATDGVHYTATGADKLAAAWVTAIGGSATPPPPPPPPPPPASGRMSSADINRLIFTSDGQANADIDNPSYNGQKYFGATVGGYQNSNEMPIAGLQSASAYGSWSGRAGDYAYGAILRAQEANFNPYAPYADGHYTDPSSGVNVNQSTYMRFMECWGVFMQAHNSTGQGSMDLKQVSLQWWLTDNTWVWGFKNAAQIVWSPRWRMGPLSQHESAQGYAGGNDYNPTYDATNKISTLTIDGGGTGSGNNYQSYACHFTIGGPADQYLSGGNGKTQFTSVIPLTNPYRIKGWVMSARVRRNASLSASGHTGLLHLSFDPKYFDYGHDGAIYLNNGVFPNARISISMKLTNDWQDLYVSSFTNPAEANNRVPSWALFRDVNNRPMYPF